jgi:hypothetical protein
LMAIEEIMVYQIPLAQQSTDSVGNINFSVRMFCSASFCFCNYLVVIIGN